MSCSSAVLGDERQSIIWLYAFIAGSLVASARLYCGISFWSATARSPKGAYVLWQLMADTRRGSNDQPEVAVLGYLGKRE